MYVNACIETSKDRFHLGGFGEASKNSLFNSSHPTTKFNVMRNFFFKEPIVSILQGNAHRVFQIFFSQSKKSRVTFLFSKRRSHHRCRNVWLSGPFRFQGCVACICMTQAPHQLPSFPSAIVTPVRLCVCICLPANGFHSAKQLWHPCLPPRFAAPIFGQNIPLSHSFLLSTAIVGGSVLLTPVPQPGFLIQP